MALKDIPLCIHNAYIPDLYVQRVMRNNETGNILIEFEPETTGYKFHLWKETENGSWGIIKKL